MGLRCPTRVTPSGIRLDRMLPILHPLSKYTVAWGGLDLTALRPIVMPWPVECGVQ